MSWLQGIEARQSSNHGPRGGYRPEGVVWHYTAGGSAVGSVRWLRMPEAQASAHFVVGRDGIVVQLVSLERCAWHAGTSELLHPTLGECMGNVGQFTIGVEVACFGLLERDSEGSFWVQVGRRRLPYSGPAPEYATLRFDSGHEVSGWWEPYTDLALESCRRLHQRLCEFLGHDLWMVGHQDVAMPLGRKIDPGPLWPRDLLTVGLLRASPSTL